MTLFERATAASLITAVLVAFTGGVSLAQPSSSQPIKPALGCAALAKLDFTGVPDAITEITSATVQTTNGASNCDVRGYISPQTHFQIDLPLSTWRGDYVQEGCGGRCGSVALAAPGVSTGCSQVTNNELVLAVDDMGHEGGSGAFDSIWAANEPALRAVFGYSSEHSLAQASKAIIGAFYGKAPQHSYFDGCSTGGREALTEAQRYPTDFDGIVAGAPVIYYAQLSAELHSWQYQVNTNAQGQDILTPDKLPALHAAVKKACADAQGLILDPRSCTFDPVTIQCPPGVDAPTCLTPEQVKVTQQLYSAPADSSGRNLYPGGEPYGSELAWIGSVVAPAGQSTLSTGGAQAALGYLKYMAYPTDPPASYTLQDFAFTDAEYAKLAPGAEIFNATDPNLQAFRDHGGKIILYHGWADQANPPFGTVDYYGEVARLMGGYDATQAFSRLYMIPAQYHCLGGGDPNVSANFLSPIISWVENGQAPGVMTFPVLKPAAGSLQAITVAPFNPLAPVQVNGHSLNSYNYIGDVSGIARGQSVAGQLTGVATGAIKNYSVTGDGSVLNLKFTYSPGDPITDRGVGFIIYDASGNVVTKQAVANATSRPLSYQLSTAAGATYTLQVFDYIPGAQISYALAGT